MGLALAVVPGSLGDGRLILSVLEHGFKWLTGVDHSFWNAPFFYPTALVTTFSDSMLGALPIYALLRAFHLDPYLAFQLWTVILYALNYITCAWALRRFSFDPLPAAMGAYVFSFCLPAIGQIDHPHLLPRFMVPIAFLFLFKVLQEPSIKNMAGLYFAVAYQFYCSIYIGYFLCLLLLCFLLAYTILHLRQGHAWREWLTLIREAWSKQVLLLIAFICSLMPVVIPYLLAFLAVQGAYPRLPIEGMLPRWSSYFMPPPGTVWQTLYKDLAPTLPTAPVVYEHYMFVGALPWVAVAVVVVAAARGQLAGRLKFVAVCAVALAISIIFVTKWSSICLYLTVCPAIPGSAAIRAMTRIVLVQVFFFAIAVAALFELAAGLSNRRAVRALILTAISLALICDSLHSSDGRGYLKEASQSRVRSIVESFRHTPGGKLLAFVFPARPDGVADAQIDAMLAAQELNVPTINGYSGRRPDFYDIGTSALGDEYAVAAWLNHVERRYGLDLSNGLVVVGAPQDILLKITSCACPLSEHRGRIEAPAGLALAPNIDISCARAGP